jgi:hypothetical protein
MAFLKHDRDASNVENADGTRKRSRAKEIGGSATIVDRFFQGRVKEEIQCPICGTDIGQLMLAYREAHVDNCLTEGFVGGGDIDQCTSQVASGSKTNAHIADVVALETGLNSDIPDSRASSDQLVDGSTEYSIDGNSEEFSPIPDYIVTEESAKTEESLKVQVFGESDELVEQVLLEDSQLQQPATTVIEAEPRPKYIPFYKVIQFGDQKIAVDAFSYSKIPEVSNYFLT